MGLPVERSTEGLQVDRREMGKADTLRFNVSTFVVEEDYERAIGALQEFLSSDFKYPNFKPKVERYIEHCIDLVNAIRAKRKFPGMNHMTMAKKQEINKKYKEHFNELQYVLRKVEQIQIGVKLDDLRSTAWVVKALFHGLFAVCLVALMLELGNGLFTTAVLVIDDFFLEITHWLMQKIV
jgi:hypothetical protein